MASALLGCLAAGTIAACGLTLDGPDSSRAAIPTRAIAPWTIAALSVCIGDDCGPDAGSRVHGADLRYQEDRWQVIAEIDGNLHLGTLEPGWQLQMEAEPVLGPELGWHGAGLRDPDWGPGGVAFGLADGSATGWANWVDGELVHAEESLWSAAFAGYTTVTAPSIVGIGDLVRLVFVGDHDELRMAWGPTLETAFADTHVGNSRLAAGDGWRDLESFDDPHLDVDAEGNLRLFFAARGKESPDHPEATAPVNSSIGFAILSPDGSFTAYEHNPVHDKIDNLLFHAEEASPSVAIGPDFALMLTYDSSMSATGVALAVHEYR